MTEIELIILGIYLIAFLFLIIAGFLVYIIYILYKFEKGLIIIAEKYFSLDESLSEIFDTIGEQIEK